MKTTLAALFMCIVSSMQLFANHDIVVNHTNKTVTILANFITSSPITNSMTKAADIWNNKSSKCFCKVTNGGKEENYSINFRVVVNQNPLSDTAVNIVAVLPDNHPFFKDKIIVNSVGSDRTDKVVGVTDGRTIAICNSYRNDKFVLANQMGLSLGLCKKTDPNENCSVYNITKNFELEKSVSELADITTEKHKTTRKYLVVGGFWDNYVAYN